MNKDIIVEFVADINERSQEITSVDNENWTNVYESESYTGSFIRETDRHPSYILIQSGRTQENIVRTAFHEMRHAIDFYVLLKLMDDDIDKMTKSEIMPMFQVYSEYEAEKFGIEHFLKYCLLDLDKHKKTQEVLELNKEVYKDTRGIKYKYHFLVHSVQYLAVLTACQEYDADFDFDGEIAQMDYLFELTEVFNMLLDKETTRDLTWFYQFDKISRKYVGEEKK